MHAAIRPALMASIAFAGAGIIATAPFTPSLPDIQIPSITTPALELAALPSYLEWVQAATDALTYQLPTLQQIIESGVDGLLPIVEQLISHPFPDVEALTTGLGDTGAAPSSSPLQDAINLVISAQTVAGDTNLIPDIVQGLVQVVQDIADFASHAVEPVLDAVYKITVATLDRLTATLNASMTDIPLIVKTLATATGSVFGSLIDNVKLVAEAAASADPLAIIKATTDGLANIQHVLAEQAQKVLAAVNKYTIDVATALALPEWLPMPPKSQPGSAVTPAAAAVAGIKPGLPSSALPAERPATGGSARDGSKAVGTPTASRTAADAVVVGGDTTSGTSDTSVTPDQPAPAHVPDAPSAGGSSKPDTTPASSDNSSSPGKAKSRGVSKRHSSD